MGAGGFEQSQDSREKHAGPEAGGNNSGNKDTSSAVSPAPERPTDPELASVVVAWPNLPPAIRAGIVAMVKASGGREP